MSKRFGDNFVPVGTDYSRGDLQCDGMLLAPKTIYACYGPVNAGANATEAAIKTAVDKVQSDFDGALHNWPDLACWTFVHNYFDIPAQILHKFQEVQASNSNRTLALFGKEQFEKVLFELDADAIDDLIGDAATDEDFRSLQPAEVLHVVNDIMSAVHLQGVSDDQPVQVPEQKLHFNGLSQICRSRIVDGIQNAGRVATLLQDHQDPLLDARLAGLFKGKYLDLKAQALEPDDILFELYDFAAGGLKTSATREVAVWSLLAHLFEKCTIFEDAPVQVDA